MRKTVQLSICMFSQARKADRSSREVAAIAMQTAVRGFLVRRRATRAAAEAAQRAAAPAAADAPPAPEAVSDHISDAAGDASGDAPGAAAGAALGWSDAAEEEEPGADAGDERRFAEQRAESDGEAGGSDGDVSVVVVAAEAEASTSGRAAFDVEDGDATADDAFHADEGRSESGAADLTAVPDDPAVVAAAAVRIQSAVRGFFARRTFAELMLREATMQSEEAEAELYEARFLNLISIDPNRPQLTHWY